MSFKLYVRHSAELDLSKAQLWYEDQQAGLAAKFYYALSCTLDRLSESPFIYPLVYRNIQRVLLHRFPYLVWFSVDGSVVTVLACTHGKANPNKTQHRLLNT